MYFEANPRRVNAPFSSKVNTICDSLRSVFETLSHSKYHPLSYFIFIYRYLLCILTTYVRKSPAELEEALKMVASLKSQKEGQLSAEKALKHLCWLVEPNKLFDVALGLYDFPLVLMVAQKSQKDPKEYIPFLTNLEKLEKYYQRFTIDMHLSRYSSALIHLSQAGDQYFDDVLAKMKQYELYSIAIDLYLSRKDSSKLFVILDLFGDYLLSKGYSLEAGSGMKFLGKSNKE